MFNPVITSFMALLMAIAGGSVAYVYYGSFSLVAAGLAAAIMLLPVLIMSFFRVYRRYGITLTAYMYAVIASSVNIVSLFLLLTERVREEEVNYSVTLSAALFCSSALMLFGYSIYAAFSYKQEKIDVEKLWGELPMYFYEPPADKGPVVEEVLEDTVEKEEPEESVEAKPVEDDPVEAEPVDYTPQEFDTLYCQGTESTPKRLRGADVEETETAPKWEESTSRGINPEEDNNLMFMPQQPVKPRRGL